MSELYDIINFFKIYYNNFIIKIDDKLNDKLNKLIMFFIYLLIIFIIFGSNLRSIPLALIFFILLIKFLYIKEEFDQKIKCRKPTINNPFMNTLYVNDGLIACENVSDKEIDKNFNDNINKNNNDIFNKNNGQLYFRTNAVTSFDNNYKSFKDFIGFTYDEKDNNCKYNGVNCLKENNLKHR